MNKQMYQISFNTQHTSDNDRWKLFYNGQETLHSDIVVNLGTYISNNYSQETKDNWNITCSGYLTMKDNVAYIDYVKQKLEEGEQSGFVDNFDPYKHLKEIASMDIQFINSTRVFYEETYEHKFQINGEEHIFRVFDSMDERQFWFDDEIYFSVDDEVMDNLTIQDLLDWV